MSEESAVIFLTKNKRKSKKDRDKHRKKDIHKMIQKLAFGCVSLAANFRSSLAPCYSAMVARSRRKNWRRFLAKNQLLNHFVYKILKEFRDQFKSFSDENDYPEEFIDKLEWGKIMNSAKRVLKSFNYK